jgi:hypothetical protein
MNKALTKIYSIINDSVKKDSALIIQAGHFLLLYDKHNDKIIPGIYSHMKKANFDEQLCEEYGLFPLLTWEIAIKLLGEFQVTNKRLLVLVNDWQYLKHLKNRRHEFYNHYSKLPDEYNIMMEKAGLTDSIILRPPAKTKTGKYYSEIYLRNKFQWSIKKMGKTVNLRKPSLKLEATGAFCGRPNCTAEVAQLISDAALAYDNSDICFVNFYPLMCKNFVEEGTKLAFKLFGLKKLNVLNIGVPNIGIKTINDVADQMVL